MCNIIGGASLLWVNNARYSESKEHSPWRRVDLDRNNPLVTV